MKIDLTINVKNVDVGFSPEINSVEISIYDACPQQIINELGVDVVMDNIDMSLVMCHVPIDNIIEYIKDNKINIYE